MNSSSSQNVETKHSDTPGAKPLSIALIGPNEARRWDVSSVLAECPGVKVREFSSYPTALDNVPRLLERYFDVIVLDLDSDQEFALDLVQSIRAQDAATVMVYSERDDRDLVARCMRSGAREFLMLPFDQATMAKALLRARTSLQPSARSAKKTEGDLLVFFGAKGGAGVTTIACNLAIALAQEPDQSTLLIDLAVPLGDAALNLGIAAEYSTDNALRDPERLDASFLQKLLSKHRSGVSVLAAPSKVPEVDATKPAIDKLMAVARQQFDHVIVDVGSRIDLMGTDLFHQASTIYLVTQAGISELRNSNRLISQFFNQESTNLEIVLNRFEPNLLAGVNEDVITKALGKPVRWKIPDDHDATRQVQSTSNALTLADSPISRLILQMASSVTGHPYIPEKENAPHVESHSNNGSKKLSSAAEKPAPVEKQADIVPAAPSYAGLAPAVTWPTPAPIPYGTSLSAGQLNARSSAPGTLTYTPGPGYVLPAGTHTLWVTFNPASSDGGAPVQAAVSITVTKGTPAVTWPTPQVIPCGSALNATHLCATSSVPGTFVYSPAAGEVLAAGKHTLSVTFTPSNNTNFCSAEAVVEVTVAKSSPAIAWSAPSQISYGTALGAAQLNASASVAGTLVYSPAAGEVLAAGTHKLSVSFTPADDANYAPGQATVSLTVAKATPAIAWQTPDPIRYGTPLSGAQLGATASVPGTFVYNPSVDAVLAAGEHTPSVLFTPNDTANHVAAQAAVRLTVAKAAPAIQWPTPDPISSGTPLSAVQLNATASVPGTFVYSPALGDKLDARNHTLSVTFTPADSINYTPVRETVSLVVTEKSPARIAWSAPAPIAYGTRLGAAQLNATASVPGTLAFAPGAGDILAPGSHMLSVTFTPADTAKYATAQATVTLVVEELSNLASLLSAASQTPLPESAAGHVASIHSASTEAQSEAAGTGAAEQKTQRETRTYKGAIYERGDDGQWHLQQK